MTGFLHLTPHRQISIPFPVAPYPDEILGNWLFRLQAHNSLSLAQELTGRKTRTRVDASGWRDISQPSPALLQLLAALGSTYSATMLKLTTYPYWLRFHSAHRFEMAQQNHQQELPALVLHDTQRAIPRLRYLVPSFSRTCSECLQEDFVQYGEPYLHRAHQLPFVRYCHKHSCPLTSKCPKCQQLFRMDSTFVYARLTCTCGYDLRRTQTDRTAGKDSWIQLARYSADVLFSTDTIEDCNTSQAFINARLAEWELKRRPNALKHLDRIYGDGTARALLTIAPQRSDTLTFAPVGSVSKHEYRAPQICALLATMDTTLAESQSRFADFIRTRKATAPSLSKASKAVIKQRLPQSVEQARLYVHDIEAFVGASKTRSHLYQRHKTLFWYLTIFDKEWFEDHYPHGRRGATAQLPSIDADRLRIEQAILSASTNRVREWKGLAQQEFFRASLRDTTWLESKKAETARAIKDYRADKRRQHLQTCESDLQEMSRQIAIKKESSLSATLSEIALYTTMNKSQWRHLLANNPDLRERLSRY